jgi:hypothetical protein
MEMTEQSSEIKFQHYHAAHCESGVTSNLLQNAGYPVSEALAFGIGSGLFFVHLPFVKVMDLPLTSYRTYPGSIFKKTCARLKIPFEYQTFRNQLKGTRQLDLKLKEKRPVGLRTNIYWLPYIPEGFRFQFNAHNMVVFGKEANGDFRVSDPIMESTSVCPSNALLRARYSKGPLAPHGLMFYPQNKNEKIHLTDEILKKAIHKAIRETVYGMLYTPMPFAGVKGIRYLAKRMAKWPKQFPDADQLKLALSHIVRMQEEIGTGGGGFRFLYATFLQEAGARLQNAALTQASRDLCEAGTLWREFATKTVQFCKDRLEGPYSQIPQILLKIAEKEQSIYRDLRRNYL